MKFNILFGDLRLRIIVWKCRNLHGKNTVEFTGINVQKLHN